jgi:hypothetical protein
MSTDAVVLFVIQHKSILLGLIFWPLITAVMNVMLRKKTAEEWEAWAMAKPALAFLVEVLRAAGLDPSKLMVAFQRYAQRRSGVVPEDAIRMSKLPPVVQKALLNPEMVKTLQDHLELGARPTEPPAG